MSARLDTLLSPAQRADCARTDAELTHKRTLGIDGQQVAIDALNDDDVYVINLRSRCIVERWGSSGLHAQSIKGGGSWWCPLGCAVLTGLQAKGLL
jgi:hypothetical protein